MRIITKNEFRISGMILKNTVQYYLLFVFLFLTKFQNVQYIILESSQENFLVTF